MRLTEEQLRDLIREEVASQAEARNPDLTRRRMGGMSSSNERDKLVQSYMSEAVQGLRECISMLSVADKVTHDSKISNLIVLAKELEEAIVNAYGAAGGRYPKHMGRFGGF